MPARFKTALTFAASLLLVSCTGNVRHAATGSIGGTSAALNSSTEQRAADPSIHVERFIDDSQTVTLEGNTHPLALPEYDQGTVDAGTKLGAMMLLLKPSAAQQAELDALVAAQQNPRSLLYHRWLTPAEFGARFGASESDLVRVTAWLTAHGFTVDEIPAGRRLIRFSGTAGQILDAFHAGMHRYSVQGVSHVANAIDPQIPASLAGIVEGVVSLNDFRRRSELRLRTLPFAQPQYSADATHYLFPADFATIYNLGPVYGAGTRGAGTAIAIAARSNIRLSDVANFRSVAGLEANAPSVIVAGTDPGLVADDQQEATLDVEWSGAVAPEAAIKLVAAASTVTADGVDLAAQYIVNHAVAPIVSVSYGSCEQQMSTAELAFYNSLWEQAASQGMSVFVASGDAGAAGCAAATASSGAEAAVNGLCSSPYSTCVGGTEFMDSSNPAQYWSTSNSSSYGSALGYIPETVWNESASDGGTGLWASGGGESLLYAQPGWQAGIGGTGAANGMRAVPDVALSAADHDGYFMVENGSYSIVSGTSAAAPSFAGIMALVVQEQGGVKLGAANSGLYALSGTENSPFHATLSGNNSVPGVVGFTASGEDYNLATGLGSVDGSLLVNGWGTTAKPTLSFTAAASEVKVQRGSATELNFTATTSGAFAGNIHFSVSGLPGGVTAAWSADSITPDSGASSSRVVLKLTASATATMGSFKIAVTAEGDGLTTTQNVAVMVQSNRRGCSGLSRLPMQCAPPPRVQIPAPRIEAQ